MKFIGQRLLHSLFVLWAVVTILFLMFRLMPGNPMAAYISEALGEDEQAAIMRQFGLDQPMWQQYLIYLANLAHGQLGLSFHQRQPVWDIVMGVFAGAFLAWKRGTWIEGVTIPLVLGTRAAPEFWVGMVLLAVFAFTLGWFPSGGANSAGAFFGNELERFLSADFLSHLVLPMLTLALYLQGLPLLLMRSTMLEVMHEDFVTMARMKGLSEWRIVIRHAARNALLPVITAFAISFGQIVGGNVVVETVFSWPGLGRMLVNAVSNSDYPLAQGAFLLITIVLIAANLVAELLYTVLDPRVTHARVS
jgi:peptide/nickel transport system permease protein